MRSFINLREARHTKYLKYLLHHAKRHDDRKFYVAIKAERDRFLNHIREKIKDELSWEQLIEEAETWEPFEIVYETRFDCHTARLEAA